MTVPDPIAASLDRRYHSCCQPRRHQRIQTRWQHYPALAGLAIPDIRQALTTPNANHNTLLADLLRAHQSGDGDATTVLLAAFIPYVCSDPAIPIGPDRIADRWAALGHLLATIDPADSDRPDEQRPFLLVLVGRMRRHAARLRYGPDPHTDHTIGGGRADVDLDARHPTSPTVVEDHVLARLDLATIARHLQAGTIKPFRWQRLVADRIHGPVDRRRRRSVSHTAHRLAVLTDRVA